MIKFYHSRELARRFGINLAKWKRWAREFLPPDPLGGLQSGFARQYCLKDAFKVYLAGFLVSELKYRIPEAKEVATVLTNWLESQKLLSTHELNYRNTANAAPPVVRYIVIVSRKMHAEFNSGAGFVYQIRGLISNTTEVYEGVPIRVERYVEVFTHDAGDKDARVDQKSYQTLNLTHIIEHFMRCLKQPVPA